MSRLWGLRGLGNPSGFSSLRGLSLHGFGSAYRLGTASGRRGLRGLGSRGGLRSPGGLRLHGVHSRDGLRLFDDLDDFGGLGLGLLGGHRHGGVDSRRAQRLRGGAVFDGRGEFVGHRGLDGLGRLRPSLSDR